MPDAPDPPPPDAALPYASRLTGKADGGLVPVATGLILVTLGLLEAVACGIIAAVTTGSDSRHAEGVQIVAALISLPGALCVLAGLFITFRALRRFDW